MNFKYREEESEKVETRHHLPQTIVGPYLTVLCACDFRQRPHNHFQTHTVDELTKLV